MFLFTLGKVAGNYESRFIFAKSRVSPLKELTIPSSELEAAVLASRLYKTITEECRLQFERVIFFTDSMIVLTWIRNQSREFKPFVSSNVAEIQTNCDPSTWRHIPSEHNVAVYLSRGIPAKDLEHRWNNGPKFLNQPKEEWPEQPAMPIDPAELDKAIVTYDSKHPVLLPKNHHISYLITKDVHQITHTGIASTAAKTRRKFWIIEVQKLAKLSQKKCI